MPQIWTWFFLPKAPFICGSSLTVRTFTHTSTHTASVALVLSKKMSCWPSETFSPPRTWLLTPLSCRHACRDDDLLTNLTKIRTFCVEQICLLSQPSSPCLRSNCTLMKLSTTLPASLPYHSLFFFRSLCPTHLFVLICFYFWTLAVSQITFSEIFYLSQRKGYARHSDLGAVWIGSLQEIRKRIQRFRRAVQLLAEIMGFSPSVYISCCCSKCWGLIENWILRKTYNSP